MASVARRRRGAALTSGFALAVVVAALLAPAAAQARTITVGSSLTGSFGVATTFLFPSLTVTNSVLADPEANVVSPVDGVVLRWRLGPQAAADAYALRVLHPAGGSSFTGAGTSVARVASTTSIQSYPTNLPIRAGDAIGLDPLRPTPSIQAASLPGAMGPYWGPALGDGATAPSTGAVQGFEFGFNAEVQPAPRTVLLAPNSGPVAGGSAVTIAGSDFTGVSSVKFGGTPATSFVVNSESQITASAPPAAGPGPVDVTVTTVAGTTPAIAGDLFTYTTAPVPPPSCVVPKLTGKKLKAGRKALTKANCKLGKVTGKKGKAAKVVKQNPKPGAVKARGSTVSVKLG
jgi:hypothetical protein